MTRTFIIYRYFFNCAIAGNKWHISSPTLSDVQHVKVLRDIKPTDIPQNTESQQLPLDSIDHIEWHLK